MPKLPQAAATHARPKMNRPGDPIADVLGIEGDLGAPITTILPFDEYFAVTTGDGRIAFASDDFEAAEVVTAHKGCILSAAVARAGVIAGGDDGRVTRCAPGKPVANLWRSSGKWIDHVAVSGSDVVA